MDEYEALLYSPYGELLEVAIRDLDRSVLYQNPGFHGVDHIIRTMTLGTYVCRGESYSPRETELVLLCCSYHDISRINDSYDELHGPRAADRIAAGEIPAFSSVSKEELSACCAAIATHSQHDDTASANAALYGVTDDSLFRKLMIGLKDADNMDRVRIFDLDPRHLRSETAKNGVAFAEQLLEKFPTPVKPWWTKKK